MMIMNVHEYTDGGHGPPYKTGVTSVFVADVTIRPTGGDNMGGDTFF